MAWVIVFAAVAVGIGFLAAGLVSAFMSISSGFSEIGSGFFLLLWVLFTIVLFAWMMSIRERFRTMSNRSGRMGSTRARIEAERKRAEDPFYEPNKFFPLRPGKRKPVIDPSWDVTPERDERPGQDE